MTVDFFLIDAPHAVPQEFQAWEAAKAHHRAVFLRCVDAEDGSAEQSRLDTEGWAAKAEADRLEQAARTAWLRAKRQSVEIHINNDTRETRHCFTEQPLRIHAGFTHQDAAAGWRQVLAFSSSPTPDADTLARIERAKSDAVSQLESYWAELAEATDIQRVICQGVHYTWDSLGQGIGFGGQAFRVEWLDADREPTECNLFAQGRIPVWMREKLPDNARSIEDLGYRIDPFPAVDDSLDDDPPY